MGLMSKYLSNIFNNPIETNEQVLLQKFVIGLERDSVGLSELPYISDLWLDFREKLSTSDLEDLPNLKVYYNKIAFGIELDTKTSVSMDTDGFNIDKVLFKSLSLNETDLADISVHQLYNELMDLLPHVMLVHFLDFMRVLEGVLAEDEFFVVIMKDLVNKDAKVKEFMKLLRYKISDKNGTFTLRDFMQYVEKRGGD